MGSSSGSECGGWGDCRRGKALSDKWDVPALRRAHVPAEPHPRRRTHMPTNPHKPTASRAKPATFTGSASVNALIDQVAPAILRLLADGVPRTKGVIVQALAGRHGAEAVALALIRLSVTGDVEQTGSKYTLAAPDEDGPPKAA